MIISLQTLLNEILNEGVDDPAIFKAIFMGGGPASGKSYVVRLMGFQALGFKIVNSDDIFEYKLKQAGLSMDPETIFSAKGQELRNYAKQLLTKQAENYYDGRLGVVVDGTGKDYQKIKSQKEAHENELGYDTMMIFVNTDLETAKLRNAKRERKLKPDELVKMWSAAQSNIGKFQNLFKNNFYVLDNSTDSDSGAGINSLYKKVLGFSKKEPRSPKAQAWIYLQKNIEI